MNSTKVGALVLSVAVIMMFVYWNQSSRVNDFSELPEMNSLGTPSRPQTQAPLPPGVKAEPIVMGGTVTAASTPAFKTESTPVPVVGKNLSLQVRVRTAATNEFFRATGVMFSDMLAYDSELDLANPDFAVLTGLHEKNGAMLFIGTARSADEASFNKLIRDIFENAPDQWTKESVTKQVAGCRNCSFYSFKTEFENYFLVVGENANAPGIYHLVGLGLKTPWAQSEKETFITYIRMVKPEGN